MMGGFARSEGLVAEHERLHSLGSEMDQIECLT